MQNDVKVVEQYEGCTAYDCDAVYYIRLNRGAQASDHSHQHEETVYLMEGKVEFTLDDETQVINAPMKITIPPDAYHKFTALSDVIGLEIK